MDYHIIVNAQSGNGRGKKTAAVLEKMLKSKKSICRFYETEYAGHAFFLAESLINRIPSADRLWVVGGDGTLHEVVSAVKKANAAIPIGYFPSGTGNDFARTWKIPLKTEENFERLFAADQPIAVECFLYRKSGSQTKEVGLNSLGMGFDADVTRIAKEAGQRKKKFSLARWDRFVYLQSIIAAFQKRKTFSAQVSVDGQTFQADNLLVLAVMNHPYFGGGIKIDPLSFPTDHQLAVMMIKNLSAATLLKLLPKVLTDGSHVDSDCFQRIAGKKISVELYSAQPAQVDGELLPKQTYRLHFELSSFELWN